MTVAQAATLEALLYRPPMRLGDLGQRLGISASTLTRNLARLKERALVAVSPDPTDGRASVIELTPAGRLAAEEQSLQEQQFFESIIEHLPADDHGGTLETLDKLWNAVRAATEQCCPGAFDHLMDHPAGPERKGSQDECKICRP
jgi:DNA-binding MarR family transcriptional regulator